jgi:hypothetical protein
VLENIQENRIGRLISLSFEVSQWQALLVARTVVLIHAQMPLKFSHTCSRASHWKAYLHVGTVKMVSAAA